MADARDGGYRGYYGDCGDSRNCDLRQTSALRFEKNWYLQCQRSSCQPFSDELALHLAFFERAATNMQQY